MARGGVNDLAAAKAKKQKKIVIIGSVLLVALLAFQVPRTLKMMHRQSASAAPAPAAPAPAPSPATPAAPTGAAPATGAAAPSSSAQLGVDSLVVNADLSPAPLDGQLPDLTAFTTKDPFVQKGGTKTPGASGSGSGAGGASGKGSDGGKDASTGGSDGSFTGGSGSPVPSPPPPAKPALTSAQISVNGVEETVAKGGDFPQAPPPGTAAGLFHLVSLTAKTAKISIAGGSLASGDATLTLKLGTPLTLMNTADGSRYVIVLVATGTAATTTTPPPPPPPTTTTTPAG